MIAFSHGELTEALAACARALPCEGDVQRLAAMDVAGFTMARDGMPCGALVLGTVADGFGHDLVVYAAAGEGGGLTVAMHEFAVGVARGAGLDGVRCFTGRPGLVRRLGRLGWREVTRMMRVEVCGGRRR